MIPRRVMRSSSACVGEYLNQRCSATDRSLPPPQSATRFRIVRIDDDDFWTPERVPNRYKRRLCYSRCCCCCCCCCYQIFKVLIYSTLFVEKDRKKTTKKQQQQTDRQATMTMTIARAQSATVARQSKVELKLLKQFPFRNRSQLNCGCSLPGDNDLNYCAVSNFYVKSNKF